MHGSVLIIAKKKAAGPGGYFDPMMGHPGMAQGPMMFEMAQEEEDTEEVPMSTEPTMKGSMEKDVREIIADLRAAAQRLEDLHPSDDAKMEEGEEEDEGEEEEEEEEPEEAPAPKAKKPFPGFGPKKEMKY